MILHPQCLANHHLDSPPYTHAFRHTRIFNLSIHSRVISADRHIPISVIPEGLSLYGPHSTALYQDLIALVNKFYGADHE